MDDFLLSGTPASNREIAQMFGVHPRTVRKHRKALRDKGLLNDNKMIDNTKLTIEGDSNHVTFTGLETTNPLDPTQTDGGAFAKIFELAGVDQADFDLVQDSFKFSTWQQSKATEGGERDLVQLYSYRGTFQKRDQGADVSARQLASRIAPIKATIAPEETFDGLPLIVNLADLQISKRDVLGGMPELVQRFESTLAQIAAIAKRDHPREIVIADVGDICENTQNNTSVDQSSTNDLPLSEQMEWANRLITQAIITLAPYAGKITVIGVPSNHGRDKLSNGKQNKHGDWGVSNIRTLETAFELLKAPYDVKFLVPNDYETMVGYEVDGCLCVWFHGDGAGTADRVPQYVANQAATPNTVWSNSNALFYGHFHHLRQISTRGRDIFGCPTLDSGSSWLRNKTGEWSNPGVLIARVKNGRVVKPELIEP